MCFKYDTRSLAARLQHLSFDCWAAEQASGLLFRNTAASVCRKPCWVLNFGKRVSEATRSAAMRRVCNASLTSASGIWREGCDASHGSVRTYRQHGLLHMCTWRRVGDASWRRCDGRATRTLREPWRLTCLNGRRVPDAPCSVTSRQSFELDLFSFRITFVGPISCFLQVFPRFREFWLTPMPS